MNNELKFSFGAIGLVKKGSIVNGNITMIYGFPNTGKSFILRSIYASLSMLDQSSFFKLEKSVTNIITEVVEDQIESELSFSFIYKISLIVRHLFIYCRRNKVNLNYDQAKEIIGEIAKSIDVEGSFEVVNDIINFKLTKELNLKIGTYDLKKILENELKLYSSRLVGANTKKIDKNLINGMSIFKEIDNTFSVVKFDQEYQRIDLKGFESIGRGAINFDNPNLQVDELSYELSKIDEHSMTIKFDSSFSLPIPSILQ